MVVVNLSQRGRSVGEVPFLESARTKVRKRTDLPEGGDIDVQKARGGREIGALEGFEDVADFAVGVVVLMGGVQVGRSKPGGPQIEQ